MSIPRFGRKLHSAFTHGLPHCIRSKSHLPLRHDTALPRSGTPCPDSAIVVDNVAANMIRKRVRHHLQTANFIVYSAEMSFICEPLLFYINIVSIALQMVE